MKINVLLLVLAGMPLFLLGQKEKNTPFTKLYQRYEKMKSLSEQKQADIISLKRQLEELGKREITDRKSKERLEEAIQGKTAEIFILRSQLSDLMFEYNQLLKEVKLLSDKSERAEQIVFELEQGKVKLTQDIKKMNLKVQSLTDSLTQANRSNELLIAKNRALAKRVDELLNVKRSIAFAEVAGQAPYGYKVSVSFGKLTKGNTLYVGGQMGIAGLKSRLDSLDVTMVPFSAQVRVPITRRKFNFQYLDPDESPFDNVKFFFSVEAGYTLLISRRNIGFSKYNQGGLNFSVGVGGILSATDNANLFAIIAWNNQQLTKKTLGSFESRVFSTFNVGLGANF
ncbi:MAG: hypothetical protein AAF206_07500 [Bacteroidota bacterium]